jgi:hypothetical protein
MKSIVANKIGHRKSADIKRFMVEKFPTFILRFLNKSIFNFIPREVYESDVLFIHVPKVAGTSISHALYGKSIGHQKASFIYKVDPELRSSKVSISILRDPLQRVYSAYQFIRMGGTKDVVVDEVLSLEASRKYNFSDFVKNWLEPNFDSIENFDYVFWPQYWFVCDSNGSVIVDHVYFINNISLLENFLLENDYISNKLERKNSSGDFDDRVDFERETVEIIERLYEKDYNLMSVIK